MVRSYQRRAKSENHKWRLVAEFTVDTVAHADWIQKLIDSHQDAFPESTAVTYRKELIK